MQKINLLNALPKKSPVKFNTAQLSLIAGFVVVVWVGVIVAVNVYHSTIKQDLQNLSKKRDQLVKAVSKGSDDEINKEAKLEAKVKELKKEVSGKNVILNALKNYQLSSFKGFYSYLKMLSEFTPEEIWLTNIDIEKGGAYFSLTGYTENKSLLLQYLTQLNQQSLLQNTKNRLHLKRLVKGKDENHPKAYLFMLETKDQN